MYIQITSRCNMRCAHCCSSCGKAGEDMTKETFVKALDLCASMGETPFIGGGEPTVHPLFWEFIGLMLGRAHEIEMDCLGMVTNGKRTEDALALAALARKGVMSVELSRDRWHDEIDERVVKAFTKQPRNLDGYSPRADNDFRGIRTVTRIAAAGRGKKIAGAEPTCPCPEVIVDPKGRVWACGCRTKQYGTVDEPHIPGDFERECEGVEKKTKEEVEA